MSRKHLSEKIGWFAFIRKSAGRIVGNRTRREIVALFIVGTYILSLAAVALTNRYALREFGFMHRLALAGLAASMVLNIAYFVLIFLDGWVKGELAGALVALALVIPIGVGLYGVLLQGVGNSLFELFFAATLHTAYAFVDLVVWHSSSREGPFGGDEEMESAFLRADAPMAACLLVALAAVFALQYVVPDLPFVGFSVEQEKLDFAATAVTAFATTFNMLNWGVLALERRIRALVFRKRPPRSLPIGGAGGHHTVLPPQDPPIF